MKTPLIVLLVLLLTLPLAISGQEISLDLSDSASIADTENSANFSTSGFSGATTASPSFVLPLGSKAELRGLGYVKVAYPTSDTTELLGYDLQLLRLELALKDPREGMDSFVFVGGRSNFSDPTGYIVSAPVDQLSFRFGFPGFAFTFNSAYTGFLFLDTSPFLISLTDQNRSADGDELLGSKRFLGSAEIEIPSLFGQRFAFSALVQNDVNDSADFAPKGGTTFQSGKGGALSTQYFVLAGSGVIGIVNYELFGAYGSGRILSWLSDSDSVSGFSYQYAPISSYFAGLSVKLPIAALSSSFGFRAMIASGDKEATGPVEGNASSTYLRFTPLTRTTLGLVFSPYLSNLVFVEAGMTTNQDFVFKGVSGYAKLMSFLRPTSGPISESGLEAGSTSPYLGSELDLGLNYGILSDLAVSFGIGMFLPGEDPAGAFAADYAGSKLQVAGTLAVTLKL